MIAFIRKFLFHPLVLGLTIWCLPFIPLLLGEPIANKRVVSTTQYFIDWDWKAPIILIMILVLCPLAGMIISAWNFGREPKPQRKRGVTAFIKGDSEYHYLWYFVFVFFILLLPFTPKYFAPLTINEIPISNSNYILTLNISLIFSVFILIPCWFFALYFFKRGAQQLDKSKKKAKLRSQD